VKVAGTPRPAAATGELRAPVSVLITARDEEDQLPQALASLENWPEEVVVVVDPRTVDRTRAVAADAGARVLEHPFVASAAQCNWGVAQCRHDWVLVLDADERVTPELRGAIDAALVHPEVAAFAMRRHNFAFGRRLRFGDWGGDWVLRLLDRRQARFVERAVHGGVEAPSRRRLQGAIEHRTLRSLEQYLAKLHEYARRGAEDAATAGARASATGALAHGVWRLLRSFLLRFGFLDGGTGLIVAALAGYGSFLKWAAVWESTTRRRARP
jgi:glycosyltransferase involved in cell wall biosynthesis